MVDFRSMQFTENTRFTAASGEPPCWRRFGDEAVVFNPTSGDTHLLAGPVVVLLEAIIHGEKSYLDVRELFFAQRVPEASASRRGEYLEQALSELARLDLVSVAGASEA